MTTIAVSMCKDEADIAEPTLRRMARQVDALLVADNQSSDGTREILDALALELPLTVLDDPELGYFQSQKMTFLADQARQAGASWVVPFDFDEVWLGADGRRISDILDELAPNVLVAEAPLFDHVATGEDAEERDPIRRLAWRRATQAPLRKVAVRAMPGLTIHQGNHAASFRGVRHPPAVTNALQVRHFPYRSVAQFVSKARNGAAAYAATDLPEEVGGHWRGYGRILADQGEGALAEVFHQWFWRAAPSESLRVGGELQPPLVFDPCA